MLRHIKQYLLTMTGKYCTALCCLLQLNLHLRSRARHNGNMPWYMRYKCSFRCRTYTTDYAGTVTDSSANADTETAESSWEHTTEGPDRGMLMARDPILFWDEIPLYESELDDNGVSQLRVKVRSFHRCTSCIGLPAQFAMCNASNMCSDGNI